MTAEVQKQDHAHASQHNTNIPSVQIQTTTVIVLCSEESQVMTVASRCTRAVLYHTLDFSCVLLPPDPRTLHVDALQVQLHKDSTVSFLSCWQCPACNIMQLGFVSLSYDV